MATFPAVPYSINSSQRIDLGVNSTTMADGRQSVQVLRDPNIHVIWSVNHSALTQSQVDQVVNFLKANAADEFTFEGHFGHVVSNPRVDYDNSPVRFRVAWTFRGRRA